MIIKRKEIIFEGFQIWDSFFLDMLYEWHEEKFGYYYEDEDDDDYEDDDLSLDDDLDLNEDDDEQDYLDEQEYNDIMDDYEDMYDN